MSEKAKLEITSSDAPVPAFTCLIYVAPDEGRVRARVVNLAGIEAVGNSEREALGKVVPAFKQQIAEFLGKGEEIPWIDQPEPPKETEQKRIVPVHL